MLAGALGSTGFVFWVLTFDTTSGFRCCVLFSSKIREEGRRLLSWRKEQVGKQVGRIET